MSIIGPDGTVVFSPTQSQLVFHSTPHYNLRFQPVSNIFHINDENYQEAIGMQAFPYVLSFFLVTLLFMVLLLRWANRQKRTYSASAVELRHASHMTRILLVLLVLALLSAIVMLVASILAQGQSGTASTNLNVANGFFAHLTANASLAGLQLVGSNGTAYTVATNLQNIGAPASIVNASMTTYNMLANASAELLAMAGSIGGLNLTPAANDLNTFGAVWLAVLTLGGLSATLSMISGILYILHAVTPCMRPRIMGTDRRRKLRKNAFLATAIIGVWSFILCGLGAGFYMAMIVATSDACSAPQAGADLIAASATGIEGQNIEQFYIYCAPGTQNPLATNVLLAQYDLVVANNSNSVVLAYVNAHQRSFTVRVPVQLAGSVAGALVAAAGSPCVRMFARLLCCRSRRRSLARSLSSPHPSHRTSAARPFLACLWIP